MSEALTQVECYCGSEYAEYPLKFEWQGVWLLIAETLARWRRPDGKSFRVRTAEGQVFELHYKEGSQTWSVTPCG